MREKKKIFKNKLFVVGLLMFLIIAVFAVFAPLIAPHEFDAQNADMQLEGPSAEYPFGTDRYGRCIFSRVVYGSRIALSVGLTAVVIEMAIGITLGIVAGYYGGSTDKIITFVTDATWSVPPIILAIAIVYLLEPSAINVAISVAVVSWAQFTKIVKVKVQTIKGLAYIEAAKVSGESGFNIITRYILPNLLSTITVLATLALPTAILSTTAMGFLGLGAQQPQPDWGMMLQDGILYMERAPWIALAPGVAIIWTVLGFNLAGEGIKDILDPRIRT